jgi:hypothetical protein
VLIFSNFISLYICVYIFICIFCFLCIKNDSMSYLVLPALMESGCLAEALRQHRLVVNFHIAGRRDTLDMSSRAFQHGNYMKVLELSSFADHCLRYIAVAVDAARFML